MGRYFLVLTIEILLLSSLKQSLGLKQTNFSSFDNNEDAVPYAFDMLGISFLSQQSKKIVAYDLADFQVR